MTDRRRRVDRAIRARRLAVVVAAVVVGGAACSGIPSDDDPSLVAADGLPAELAEVTTTTAPRADQTQGNLYLVYAPAVGEEQLWDCPVSVDDAAADGLTDTALHEAQARINLRALLELVPAESSCDSRFTNAIPPNLELLGVSLDEGVLNVDLGNLGDLSEGALQRQAIAQLVFTATELPGINGVRFQQDGLDVAVAVESRSVNAGEAISPADFPTFAERLRRFPTTTTTTTTTAPPPPPVDPATEPAPPPQDQALPTP